MRLMRLMRALIATAGSLLILSASPAIAGPGHDVEIRLTLKDHRFVPAEIRVARAVKVTLIITNADATVEEFESPALNREKLIPPGQTITLFLRPLKPGVYEFFGEFNPKTATGRLIVE